jgi:predicted lipoprotein with Yx(FWY)xxD motif
MKPSNLLLAAALVCVAGGSTAASAETGAPAAHASGVAKVEVRHTKIGAILTTSSGFTLYEFTKDHGSQDSCVKIKKCLTFWPALETSGKPVAGAGAKSSLLSTTALPGGVKQVTYAGHPLYTFKEDSRGETAYIGEKAFGGNWYALNAAGHTVK